VGARFLAKQKNRSVVTEHVNTAIVPVRLFRHRPDLIFVRNISRNKDGFAPGIANELRSRFAGLSIDIGNHNGTTFVGESLSDRPADTGATARHDSCFVFEPHTRTC
jgi:hypothetical protein